MITQRMAGKSVLITGAAGEIGAEHAVLFAMHGAKVLLCETEVEPTQKIVDEIRAAGGTAEFCFLDVKNEYHWTQALDVAAEKFSGLTTLVNAAGVELDLGQQSVSHQHVATLSVINQVGPRIGMKAAMPLLLRSRNASIVNIVSMPPSINTGDIQGLEAAKRELVHSTRDIAIRFARRGLRANTVFPGVIRTSATARTLKSRQSAEFAPMGRIGFPEEVAYCSLFLCSDEASYITATEFHVDGGAAVQHISDRERLKRYA